MKVRKLKVKKNDDGLRRGYIEFKGEKVPLHALNYKDDKEIADIYELEKLASNMQFYKERSYDPKLTPEARLECDERIKDIMWKINEASNGAAYFKVFKCVERPKEWFDKLSLAELNQLTLQVSTWLMYVDTNEIYMEMFKEAMFILDRSKAESNMTGREAADILRNLENEYLSLKKKPKCLDTALRSAKARIVEDAIRSSVQNG